jgi:C4-dicarboxylate-specific signal transduction histidine kinase
MQNMLARLIGENVELATDLASQLRTVRMDPTKLQQVILNLVLNARDAIPGSGRISLQTRNCDDHCCSNPPGNETDLSPCVVLEVNDTGTGMDANTISHLFQPFFTTKEPGRGNGLGLAMVRGIVKRAVPLLNVDTRPSSWSRTTLPCGARRIAFWDPSGTRSWKQAKATKHFVPAASTPAPLTFSCRTWLCPV